MDVIIGVPGRIKPRREERISERMRERVQQLYPLARISVGIRPDDPWGLVCVLCNTGDPEDIPDVQWKELDTLWRRLLRIDRCSACGSKVWADYGYTPKEREERDDWMALESGKPLDVNIRYRAINEHNWRIMASQHTDQCEWALDHGLAKYRMPIYPETVRIVVNWPVSERFDSPTFEEYIAGTLKILADEEVDKTPDQRMEVWELILDRWWEAANA